MRTFHFVLWLDGPAELTEELENRVFEAGCDDALLGVFDGRLFLEFDRTADSAREALMSALHDAHAAGVSASGIGLGDHDLVRPAEIARRIGRTRASISQLMQGQRGAGGFPTPHRDIGGVPYWRWHSVKEWFDRRDAAGAESVPDVRRLSNDEFDTIELREVTSAYQLVKDVPDKRRRDRLLDELEDLMKSDALAETEIP